MSTVEETRQHHSMEGYLHKKEEGSRWVQYWALLQGKLLKFHTCSGNGEERWGGSSPGDLRLIGWIEITAESRCIQGKKKSYGCCFYIEKQKRRYLFKTNTPSSRQQWIDAIEHSVRELSGCTDKILVQQYILELANRTTNTGRNILFTRHEKGRLRTSHDTVSTTCSNKENHDVETYPGDDLCDLSTEKCCDACRSRDNDVASVVSSVPSCCGVYEDEGDTYDDISTRALVSTEDATQIKTLLSCVGTVSTTADDNTQNVEEKERKLDLGSPGNKGEITVLI